MTRRRALLGGMAAAIVAVVVLALAVSPGSGDAPASAPQLGKPYAGEPILSPFLEEALASGNVVILHRDARTPRGTRELAAGAPPSLREAGLAVLFEREPTLRLKLAAIANGRILEANSPRTLRKFVDRALGRAGSHL